VPLGQMLNQEEKEYFNHLLILLTFELQRHNIGKVRHKHLLSSSERNTQGTRRSRLPLSQLSENLHLADAYYRPPQCSFCGSGQHTIKLCSTMDKAALVGKKNSTGWNQWYRTLGNQKCHDVALLAKCRNYLETQS
jgi:hypothetical protein